MKSDEARFGVKIKSLRKQRGFSQVQLAEKLGVSASYLNLIESNQRALPAAMLIKLCQLFGIELASFSSEAESRSAAELYEALSDPLFEESNITKQELKDASQSSPNLSRAFLSLYRAYLSARESTNALAEKLTMSADLTGNVDHAKLPSEQVSDLLQRHNNYFPQLEDAAQDLWQSAKLQSEDLYSGLIRYLEEKLRVKVEIVRSVQARDTLRRYDPKRRLLFLSELLPTRSRLFQLAHQIGLLTQQNLLQELSDDDLFTTEESRALGRIALANYYAGAVVMPYTPFLQAAKEERYDINVIERRFRVGFEQVCQRLTSLRRPGEEGVPLHMIRIDIAGNISKRFSASGIHFARFSGICPRWNVLAAFLTPGMLRLQLSRMPDGTIFFCLARTIQKDSGGYHAPHLVQAIGLGCRVEYAKELIYSDGVDLENVSSAVPVGVTCRLCDREDCQQRALPSMHRPLQVDENVRWVSLYNRPQDKGVL
jgi:predicted transcriptional regulator/transcriptional regulator with XRE-family HTH domain